jgi:CHAT domain-containing protein
VGSPRICLALILLLSAAVFAQPAVRARELMREYRYGQALRVLSSEESEEATVLRFAAFYHLGRFHDASALLKTIDVRIVSERDSFDQVQFFLARGSLEANHHDRELAEKNYREAIRRAESPDDEIVARLSLAMLLLHEDNVADDETKKLFEEAGLLLPEAKYPSTLSYYLLQQAKLLAQSGLKEGTAPLYFAALKISESADLPMVSVSCYRVLATYFKSRRDHQKACEYQQRAIRLCIAEKEWHQSVRRLASLTYQVEETDEGKEFYRKELLHALDSRPPRNYRLQIYALLSRMGGPEAENWARKGLEESGDFPEERVMLLKALAAQLEGKAPTAELLKVYRQAESIAQSKAYREYPAFDISLGTLRHDIAEALLREHRYAEALEMLEKAAAAEQEPGRRWHLNFVLSRASDTALRLGELALARSYFQQSVEQIEAEKDETQASILAAGLFYIHTYSALLEGMESDPSSLVLGISPLAEELLRSELKDEKTYRLFIDIFNREIERARQASASGGSSLWYRGILYEAADRREEARRAYLAAFEANGGYNRHADLIDRLCLARLAYKDGGWEAANSELRKSLATAQNTSDSEYFYLAVGWAELELGNHSEALEMFGQAESEKSKPLALYGKARAQIGLQRYGPAMESVNEALNSVKAQNLALEGRLHSVRGDIERLSGRLEASRQDYLRAVDALETTRQWASLLEAYAGLQETLNGLGQGSEAAEVHGKASALLESVRDQIEPGKLRAVSLLTASSRQAPAVGRVVASDRSQYLLLQERLKREHPGKSKFNSPYSPSQLFSLRDELPEDSALILVQVFPSETYLSVFTPSEIVTRELGLGSTEFQTLAENLNDSLRRSDKTSAQRQRQLYELVIQPMEKTLRGKTRWHFLPTPEIQNIPLGALIDPGGSTLSQKRTVSLLSQNPARISVDLNNTRNTDILLLGAPTGQDLEGVRKELSQLGSQFPKSTLLTGADATTDSFLRESEKHSVVHIASHASLEGIELSDKYLSLKEIFEVKLSPGTLVVLSACDTARSEGHASSLAEAFQVAGASTVIASLWRVDDLATAELFGHFYRNLRAGHRSDDALTLAQRTMQETERWKSPYFWGGFVLIERPRFPTETKSLGSP